MESQQQQQSRLNPNRLQPSQLIRRLNRFEDLGPVISRDTLRAQRAKASYRISGDPEGNTVHLLKYLAWLIDEREIERSKQHRVRTYEEIKQAAAERSKKASTSGRDISPLPAIVDEERRRACAKDLKLFCKTYFPETFYLPWSEDHLKVVAKIESAVKEGGLYAIAMPRGEGKTSLCERSAIWAVLYGYRKFVTVIGSSEDAARELADTIKTELEENELLAEDFPEVCYPIRCLEGINNRAAGQLLNGKRTHISWSGDEIILPTVDGSAAAGAIVKAVGLTGRIRGMKRKAAGKDVRPDMVLVDDPQTDESAASPEQNRKRLRILNGAILGLAGPGKKISGVMPCTVIRPGDMADQILDRDRSPEWNGERLRLLLQFPKNMELWNKYREISVDSYRMYGDNRDATEFYRDHQTEMDSGAMTSWTARFEPGELSSVQYAMNLFFKDRESFYAEYQNEPMPEDSDDIDRISINHVLSHLNHRKRGTVPIEATTLTMYIDVQKNLLYFMVCAFSENFTCWVIDYGAYPDQKRRYFTLSDANPKYLDLMPGTGLEGAIYKALHDLTDDYLQREWMRDDTTPMHIERCVIDSGWGRSTDSVYRACRESIHAGALMPSKGVGLSAAQKPITEYKKNQGDKIGYNWWLPAARRKRTVRLLEYDTNFWKSFFRERLNTAMGDPGSFSLWGSDEEQHRMVAEHFTSETSTPTAGRWRKVDIWKLTAGRENHFLDCCVGCMVTASLLGIELMKPAKAPRPATGTAAPSRHGAMPTLHQLGGRRFTPGRIHSLTNATGEE